MTHEQIMRCIEDYSWDDGFETPSMLLEQHACGLALALELFLSGGRLFLPRRAHRRPGRFTTQSARENPPRPTAAIKYR